MSPELQGALPAATAHALREFPKESCGLIVRVSQRVFYEPCFNYASCPEDDFEIAGADFVRWSTAGEILAVVHSHPKGNAFPSARDMATQIETDLPWIIIPTNGERAIEPFVFGDGKIPALIGREFRHGVTDCYSLIRDVFRLGRDALRDPACLGSNEFEGIEWPFAPIELPEIPRDDSWWQSGQDLYGDALQPRGFRVISQNEIRPGDGFLIAVGGSARNPHNRLNHAGLLLGNNVIIHHLPMRLSRREPAGLWARSADLWVRYEGPGHDA